MSVTVTQKAEIDQQYQRAAGDPNCVTAHDIHKVWVLETNAL